MPRNSVTSSLLSIPRGGSSLHGLGTSFQPQLHTGTGSMSIPIESPPGVDGLTPGLVLGYNSGAGQGRFGMGWSLGLMSITRDVSRGVPRYNDDDPLLFMNSEVLVPVGNERYRPRTDAHAWRIERRGSGWLVTTADGTRHELGATAQSRVGPDRDRTFVWSLERVIDVHGREIHYQYEQFDGTLYLARVSYGPFAIQFGYGPRPDLIPDRRGGFEQMIAQRCESIVVSSTLASAGELRRYSLAYTNPEPRHVSLLTRISASAGVGEKRVDFPSLELGYTAFAPDEQRRHTITTVAGRRPMSLARDEVTLIDLDKEGLPGVVEDGPAGPRYFRNLGHGRWSAPMHLPGVPAGFSVAHRQLHFGDVEGNGSVDLLWADPLRPGYFPNDGSGNWGSFVAYPNRLSFDLGDPHFRAYDIDGDGRLDGLYTGPSSFLLFTNLGARGWRDKARIVQRVADLDAFPDISFADNRVYTADMTGDGLTDIVFAAGRRLSYWPYLGHGRWGRRVIVSGSPDLTHVDPNDVYLVDFDGNGAADLVVVEGTRAKIWFNRGGRSLSAPVEVDLRDASSGVTFADVLGSGRVGLLASDRDGSKHVYTEIAGEQAPYLLTGMDNGMGSITRIRYGSVTELQIEARESGHEWTTFLPLALQVVREIEVEDRFAATSSRVSLRYRNGHYEGDERELRGFAEVEETNHGDACSPTLVTVHRFDVGVDLATSEAERRRLPNKQREQRRALRGRPLSTETFVVETDGARRRVNRTEQHWQARLEHESSLGRVFSPLLISQTEDQFDSAGSGQRQRVEWSGHDPHGLATCQRASAGPIDGPDDVGLSFELTTEYAGNAELGIFGLPMRVVVADASGNLLAARHTHYDGNDFVGLALGQVVRGVETRVMELVFCERDTLPEVLASLNLETLSYHRITDAGPAAGWYRAQARYAHDDMGRRVQVMDPMGGVATIEHDELRPVAVTDAVGLTTRIEYDHEVEAIRRVLNPGGLVDLRDLDGAGRPIRVWRTVDTAEPVLIRALRYDHGGGQHPASILQLSFRRPDQLEDQVAALLDDPRGSGEVYVQASYYSGSGVELGKVTTVDPSVPGTKTVASGARVLGARGRLRRSCLPQFGLGYEPHPSWASSAELPGFSFTHDYAGRVTRSIDPRGAVRELEISPTHARLRNERDVAAERGPSRVVHFDARGRVAAVERGLANDGVVTTRYRRNPLGQLTAVLDAAGRELWTTQLDRVGRSISVVHVDTGTRWFVRDAGGRVVVSIDALGQRLEYQYDAIGRVTQVSSRASDQTTTLRRFGYDTAPDGANPAFARARLAWVEDRAGRWEYGYNAGGQTVLTRRHFNAGPSFELRRQFDQLGNLIAITYPNGEQIQFEHGPDNMIQRVPGILDRVEYDACGQASMIQFGNGVVERREFDPRQIRPIATELHDGAGVRIERAEFEFDPMGDPAVERRDDGRRTTVRSYRYDSLDRLASFGADPTQPDFVYDADGNLLHRPRLWAEPASYDPDHPHLMLGYSPLDSAPVGVSHDRAGRALSWGSLTRIEYDPFGRPASVERSDGVVVSMVYDYLGRLAVRRCTNRDDAALRYELEDLYVEESGRQDAIVRLGRQVAARLRVSGGQRSVTFFHLDADGSVRWQTDAKGCVILQREYGPFGVGEPGEDELGWIGASFDPVLRVYRIGPRLYDPRAARFLSPDPVIIDDASHTLAQPGLINPYSYALDNPMRYRDGSGRFPWLIVAAVVVGAALGAKTVDEHGGSPLEIALGAIAGGGVGYLFGAAGLASAALTGAGLSFAEAKMSGRDKPWTSAALGFAFGALSGAVGNWTPIAGEGAWINVQNAAIEIGIDAGTAGVFGGVRAAISREDIGKGFSSGALVGAALSALKIAAFGVRYQPFAKAGLEQRTRDQFLLDNANDRSDIAAQVARDRMPEPASVSFRRAGALQTLFGRSSTIGSTLTMAGTDTLGVSADYSSSVLAHELRHVAQQRALEFGFVEFFVRICWQYATHEHLYADSPLNDSFETPHK